MLTSDWLKSRSFVVSERRSGLSPVKHAWGRPIIMTTHSTVYLQLTPRLQDEMFPVSDFDHLPSLSFPLPFQATTVSTARSLSALATLVLEPPTTMWAGTSVESPSQESGNHRISFLQVHPSGLLDLLALGTMGKRKTVFQARCPRVSGGHRVDTGHLVLFGQNLATFLGLDYK